MKIWKFFLPILFFISSNSLSQSALDDAKKFIRKDMEIIVENAFDEVCSINDFMAQKQSNEHSSEVKNGV